MNLHVEWYQVVILFTCLLVCFLFLVCKVKLALGKKGEEISKLVQTIRDLDADNQKLKDVKRTLNDDLRETREYCDALKEIVREGEWYDMWMERLEGDTKLLFVDPESITETGDRYLFQLVKGDFIRKGTEGAPDSLTAAIQSISQERQST